MKKVLLILIVQVLPFLVFSQSLVSVNPNAGNAGQTLNVTITGANTNFSQGSGTMVDFSFNQGSGTTVVNSLTVNSNTSMVANVTIPANTYTGLYDVYVYNSIDGTLELFDAFNVNGITPPSITSITPNTANAGQTLNVTITGSLTNFNSNSILLFDNANITVNSTTVFSATSLIANITVLSSSFNGSFDVYVYDGFTFEFVVLENGFTVTGGIPQPEIVSITPNNAMAGQTLNVTITGVNTHFSQGSGTFVDFEFSQGSPTNVVNSLNVISNTSILANITVPFSTPDGSYSVFVNNDTDGYMYFINGFFIGNDVGVQAMAASSKFKLYPNPSPDRITIENSNEESNINRVISIYNVQGQLQFQSAFIQRKMEIDISKFAKGAYVIKIIGEDGINQKRFIKE